MFILDSLDLKILEILNHNIRTPYLEIARQTKVSGAAIHQRIAKMKEKHIFAENQLNLNPKATGFTTCAFVGIQVNLIEETTHDEVFARIKKIPEIIECHHITGKYSLLAKIYTRNNEMLKNILVEKIQSIKEVVSTETFISLAEGFNRQLPIY